MSDAPEITRQGAVRENTARQDAALKGGDARARLVGLDRAGLMEELRKAGVPERGLRMRASQLWHWLYARGVTDFAAMTTMSKGLRGELAERFDISRPEIVTEQVSADGTRKWLIRLASTVPGRPGPEVETVYIPEETRGTLCISSQVGCTLNCTFCHTGTQKLVRNLTAEEVVAQVLIARDRVGEWPNAEAAAGAGPDKKFLPEGPRAITNVVLMGMGEPLYNFDAVRQAMAIAADGEGLSLSRRRITLSTSGVVPEIPRWGREAGTMLAISLHAVRDDIRDQLVPLNRKYPIAQLLDACRHYPALSNAKRVTFEYVMLKGVNDTVADAKELVRLLKGIPSKINLIPFNPWPGSLYECAEWEQIEKFAEVVNRAGYASPIRTPRGRDIMAACGQLKSASEKLSAKLRRDMAQKDAGEQDITADAATLRGRPQTGGRR